MSCGLFDPETVQQVFPVTDAGSEQLTRTAQDVTDTRSRRQAERGDNVLAIDWKHVVGVIDEVALDESRDRAPRIVGVGNGSQELPPLRQPLVAESGYVEAQPQASTGIRDDLIEPI